MSNFEEQFRDVLLNIEMALVGAYRDHDDMIDHDALTAVNGLIRIYTAEQRGRKEPKLKMSPLVEETLDRVQIICEWHLGRETFETQDGESIDLDIEPLSLSDMILCLKRIRRSIQLWQKELGRRGYYEFVSQFIP